MAKRVAGVSPLQRQLPKGNIPVPPFRREWLLDFDEIDGQAVKLGDVYSSISGG